MILFKILRNKVNRVRKHCRSIYYESKIKDLHNRKPQDWWRKVKQLCGSGKVATRDVRSTLGPNMNFDTYDKELSNEINRAFVGVHYQKLQTRLSSLFE